MSEQEQRAWAARYCSPEQLAQMAERRVRIRKRWGMARVGDPGSDAASIGSSRQESCMPFVREQPWRAAQSREVSPPQYTPLPVQTNVAICPNCKGPVCDDAYGFVNPDPRLFVKAVPCPVCSPRVRAMKAKRRMERDLLETFGGANIPDYAEPWEFATYPQVGDWQACEEAQAFAHKETVQRGLYLWGQPGHGKTSLAVSVLKVFLSRGESGLYIRAPQYLRKVYQAARGDEKQGQVVDLCYSVTCLVLDDLGVEQASSAAIKHFYELVEERRGTSGLYTVITSNLSIESLEERWRPEGVARGEFHEGMRVTDRLRESWGALEIEGVNLREAGP